MTPDAAQALYRLPEARIGDLEPALEWALSRQDDPEAWRLACGLARRIVALAKDPGRLAEADEFLQMWLAAAERRDDRAILDECAWERIWILEKWDRGDEARRLDHYRRLRREDQMCFDFISA